MRQAEASVKHDLTQRMSERAHPASRRVPGGPKRALGVVVLYLGLWVVLKEAASGFALATPSVSMWWPPAGLAYATLLTFGLRYTPLLLTDALLSYLFLGNPADAGAGAYLAHGVADLVVYGTVAALLLRVFRIDPRLTSLRDALWFTILTAVGAVAMGAVQAGIAVWQGTIAGGAEALRTAGMYWAGDVTGILALGIPLLLLTRVVPGLWTERTADRSLTARPFASKREVLEMGAEIALAAAAAYLAFRFPTTPTLNHTHILFLPVVWAAVRYGFTHAALVVLATNASVAVVAAGVLGTLNVPAFQFGMVTVTVVGVLLGAFVSDHREYEHALEEARDKAEQAARLKSNIINNVSHELRTPLASILGYAEVLRDEAEDEQQRTFAGRITRGGERLQKTLRSVLEMAKLEDGEQALDREAVDAGAVVEEVVHAFRPEAEEKALALRVETPPTSTHARADRNALYRVVSNLVSNAVKFTEEGHVIVRVRPSEEVVHVGVEDTGAGIDEAFQEHLFEEFRQESEGLSREHEGAGLGLAIVERLAEAMDGTVAVESRKGEGSTFVVSLPRAETPAAADSAAADSTAGDPATDGRARPAEPSR